MNMMRMKLEPNQQLSSPRSTPTSRQPSATAMNRTLIKSKRGAFCAPAPRLATPRHIAARRKKVEMLISLPKALGWPAG
jgi:hypothetical protein